MEEQLGVGQAVEGELVDAPGREPALLGVGIDAHGKESLNFHLSWLIYEVVAFTISGLLVIVLIGIPMLLGVAILSIFARLIMGLLVLLASVKASNGELYRYPLTIRFLR